MTGVRALWKEDWNTENDISLPNKVNKEQIKERRIWDACLRGEEDEEKGLQAGGGYAGAFTMQWGSHSALFAIQLVDLLKSPLRFER